MMDRQDKMRNLDKLRAAGNFGEGKNFEKFRGQRKKKMKKY